MACYLFLSAAVPFGWNLRLQRWICSGRKRVLLFGETIGDSYIFVYTNSSGKRNFHSNLLAVYC